MRTGRALTVSGGFIPEGFLGGKEIEKKRKKNFGGPLSPKISDPPRDLTTTPPLLTESQTRVKILPWPNFVAAGKNSNLNMKRLILTRLRNGEET